MWIHVTIIGKWSLPCDDNSPLEFNVPDESSEEDLKSFICKILKAIQLKFLCITWKIMYDWIGVYHANTHFCNLGLTFAKTEFFFFFFFYAFG